MKEIALQVKYKCLQFVEREYKFKTFCRRDVRMAGGLTQTVTADNINLLVAQASVEIEMTAGEFTPGQF